VSQPVVVVGRAGALRLRSVGTCGHVRVQQVRAARPSGVNKIEKDSKVKNKMDIKENNVIEKLKVRKKIMNIE
jgi:hypothetical protein